MDGDGVGADDAGGITIWGMAGESKSKAKSKATDRSVRSTLTCKQLGEIAEAEFIAKAVGMGFVVARPWGDSEPYDFIGESEEEFYFLAGAGEVGARGGGGWWVQLSGARS